MNKRLLVLAVAGAFGAAGAAYAHEGHDDNDISVKVNGHVESYVYLTDDGDQTNEKRFHTEGELSFNAKVNDNVYVRADLDLNSRYSLNDEDDEVLDIEQLFGAVRINDMAKVRVGRFNNPLGYEYQDAPRKTTYSRSLISEFLDDSTELYQNNIEGVAADLNVGPAKLTVGVLNDIGGVDEENSLLAHLSGEVIPGLKLALGVLTQDAAAENLINFNAAYKLDLGAVKTTFFFDYLTASEILDSAYSVGAKAMFTDTLGATVRYDMGELDNDDEATALTVGVNWMAASNFDVRAEWRNDEEETGGVTTLDDDSVILSAVFHF